MTVVERPSSSRFQALAPCERESDYEPSGVVNFGWGVEPFSPACLRLATGGTVVFQGPANEHPIEPRRELGSAFSPIVSTRAGGDTEFEFTNEGFYPFACGRHPEEIGVIWASYGF